MQINVDEIYNPTLEELTTLPRKLSFIPSDPSGPTSVLSPEQITTYNELGYLTPFDALNQQEVLELRAFFDGALAAFMELGRDSYSINTAHLRFGRIYDLVNHPKVIAPVCDLLGSDVVAWGAHFFCKLPHDGKRVAWHQDSIYWPLNPSKTVTVWLAIDDTDPENANMQFIPRSHLHGPIDFDLSDRSQDVLNLVVENPEQYGAPAFNNTLKAGQFSMHSDLLLHGSEPNTSHRRRCGITMRYAATDVQTWHGWDQKGVVVSGEDQNGNWLNAPRPVQ